MAAKKTARVDATTTLIPHFIEAENRWVLLPPGVQPDTFGYAPRTFDQKAVVHTSDEAPIRITRAYNLEPMLPIADRQLILGAQDRGQVVGDASRGRHLPDAEPEA